MLENVHNYTRDVDDIFEEMLQKDGYELNHVIIKPGKVFPTHPTDANVTIIIVKGVLSLGIDKEEMVSYSSGQIIEVGKGTVSTLGNTSNEVVEVFVIKSNRDK